MDTGAAETSAELPCHGCGYDLRAHPEDGVCPECGASVAEARRWAAVPRRPAWAKSDPRWRRWVVAGAWVLVTVPLVDLVRGSQWAWGVSVPALFEVGDRVRRLNETFLLNQSVYTLLAFCVGVVLLFGRERGRQSARLDWTRRWGVMCSYVVLLLGATPVLYISALVMVGISAVFMSMPLKNQPGVTDVFARVSSVYLRHGPTPHDAVTPVCVAFSSIVVLLACVPLYEALRATVRSRLVGLLLAPLALGGVANLVRAGWYVLGLPGGNGAELWNYSFFFAPRVLARESQMLFPGASVPAVISLELQAEVVKWCAAVAIAVWLSVAQMVAWRRGAAVISPGTS